MRTLIVFSCGLLLLAACGNKAEKKADEKLTSALNAYKHGNYDEAKRQINSIKTLYPKAFEARKAGQDLMLDVEQNAQKQKLDSLNELLRIHLEALDAMKGDYTLEKDTAYQEIGNYLWPTQVIEKNLHRSFLRFQTDERGMLSMTSIYCGGNNIHHSSIKATLPDGTFAETPVSYDRYETTDLDEKIEKADYKGEDTYNFIRFVALNKDKKIRIEYRGDRKYTTTMSPSDCLAAERIYELAGVLAGITELKKAQEAAQLKIGFIDEKKERKEQQKKAEKE